VSARCGWLDEIGLLRCEGVGSVEVSEIASCVHIESGCASIRCKLAILCGVTVSRKGVPK